MGFLKFLIPLLVVGTLGVSLYFFTRPCEGLGCLLLQERDSYQIKDVYEQGGSVFRALYEKGDMLLRLETRSNYSQEDANRATQSTIATTRGTFEDAPAPYPDQLSDVISCGEQFKPTYGTKQNNDLAISYFEGFLNDRLVLGSCSTDQAVYSDTYTMFYCSAQKKYYQLEIIIPTTTLAVNPSLNTQILNSVVCR